MTIREGQLVLADGSVFEGELIGAAAPTGIATGEVVFNTALSGYQEIITDPSYAGQIIGFTYPHIGNYGVNADDYESRGAFCRGVIVRDLARRPSNHRSQNHLQVLLERHAIPAIAGIDTRRLTRIIRDTGAMPGAFGDASEADLKAAALAEPGTDGIDLVAQVTAAQPYTAGQGERLIVAYDFGIKTTIVRHLAGLGRVEVVPASTSAADVLARQPGRRVPLQRSRRPGHGPLRGRQHRPADRAGTDLRDLPGAPVARAGARRRHGQTPVRPPRRQSSGQESDLRHDRDHQPEPQLRGRCRIVRRLGSDRCG